MGRLFKARYALSTLGSFLVIFHLRARPSARCGRLPVLGEPGGADPAAPGRRGRTCLRGRVRHDHRGPRLPGAGLGLRIFRTAGAERAAGDCLHSRETPVIVAQRLRKGSAEREDFGVSDGGEAFWVFRAGCSERCRTFLGHAGGVAEPAEHQQLQPVTGSPKACEAVLDSFRGWSVAGLVRRVCRGCPVLKCSENRQKTVLPPPVCFGSMDINRKASIRPATGR